MLGQSEWPSFLDWMPNGFDSWEAWVAIGTILVALSTGALAFATRRLAKQTRRDVDASTTAADAASRSAEVAAGAFAAGIRPILVGAPSDAPKIKRRGEAEMEIRIPLRNVGSGLALIRESRWLEPRVQAPSTLRATTEAGAVPATEVTWLRFEAACADGSAAEGFERELLQEPGFSVDVRYQDMNGEQPQRTKATCLYDATHGWGFKEVELYHGEEISSYATLPGRSITVAL